MLYASIQSLYLFLNLTIHLHSVIDTISVIVIYEWFIYVDVIDLFSMLLIISNNWKIPF